MNEEKDIIKDYIERDFLLDFITSSSINKIGIKSILLQVFVLWIGTFLSIILIDSYLRTFFIAFDERSRYLHNWVLVLIAFPFNFFIIYILAVIGCIFSCKLLLIFINLVHKPKEGIFLIRKGNRDYEFWRLRIELKKIAIWITNNCPLPWIDTLAFRWFGVKIDFSSHLQDAWCDVEFIRFGRKVMVGQGAVVLSSMIIGKYLIIKQVIFDDYAVIGGQATIAPGTIIGKDTIIGALSTTNFKQFLEESWIYFGIPAIKLKPNKYAELRRDIVKKVDVDGLKKFSIEHKINIDEDKKELL